MSILSEERQQLVEDIHYLEYLIGVEKQHIKERMIKNVDHSTPLEQQISSLSDELSSVLAQFSARISVVEKCLNNVNASTKTSSDDNSNTKVPPPLNQQQLTTPTQVMPTNEQSMVSIVDIGRQNGLGSLQHDKQNMPFHYVMPNALVNVELLINRSEKKTLVIEIAKVSNKSLLKQLIIEVDGTVIKHKVTSLNGKSRLLSYLPKKMSGTITSTQVVLKFPERSSIEHKYAFCLSDIHCVPKMSLMKFIKKSLS